MRKDRDKNKVQKLKKKLIMTHKNKILANINENIKKDGNIYKNQNIKRSELIKKKFISYNHKYETNLNNKNKFLKKAYKNILTINQKKKS